MIEKCEFTLFQVCLTKQIILQIISFHYERFYNPD
jgi:hypothetical protein